jgi:hypothetical protein
VGEGAFHVGEVVFGFAEFRESGATGFGGFYFGDGEGLN